MIKGFQQSVLENVIVLVVLGILAGALAGAGIGMMQSKSTPSAAVGK